MSCGLFFQCYPRTLTIAAVSTSLFGQGLQLRSAACLTNSLLSSFHGLIDFLPCEDFKMLSMVGTGGASMRHFFTPPSTCKATGIMVCIKERYPRCFFISNRHPQHPFTQLPHSEFNTASSYTLESLLQHP